PSFGALDLTSGTSDARLLVKELWGCCFLNFDLNDDPRPVPLIPEAQAYVRRLHATCPFFPALLSPVPHLAAYFVYFGCRADPNARRAEEAALSLNPLHPSVVALVSESLAAVERAAPLVGEDPQLAFDRILSLYSREDALTFFPRWLPPSRDP